MKMVLDRLKDSLITGMLTWAILVSLTIEFDIYFYLKLITIAYHEKLYLYF